MDRDPLIAKQEKGPIKRSWAPLQDVREWEEGALGQAYVPLRRGGHELCSTGTVLRLTSWTPTKHRTLWRPDHLRTMFALIPPPLKDSGVPNASADCLHASEMEFVMVIGDGAVGNVWSGMYIQNNLCALEGSTVFMNGSYTHPTGLNVTKTFWLINPVPRIEPTDLRNEPGYSGRVEYLGDKQKHFSLRLSDVKKTDENRYCFRIRTTVDKERWTGYPGVRLTVTDLQVIAPAEVTEGQSAVLTCKTTCSLTDPTFIWYKTSRDLTTKTIKSNKVHLQSVSSEDAGSYSCAVRGYEHLPSPDHTLRVRYSPKNVSVSISPSGEIVEGSSVTLTCSSDANPPVENYTWFKGRKSIGKGKTYTISNISSEDSGEYKCKCSNEVGHQESSSVTLNVLYRPKNVSVSISPSGVIVEGSSVTLTCSSDANPPVENYTWFKVNESSAVGSGQSYRALQSGQYYCEAQNKHGSERSAAVSVTLNGSSSVISHVAVGVGCFGLLALLSLFKLR
ncbi:B-cell receptor CD22-like [Clarias gariepinus]